MPSAKPIDALIAGNVRAARARAGLQQQDLADRLRWSRPTVSDLERGKRRVTVDDAAKICAALEIDLAELLRGVDDEVFRALGL